jgi:hypothetical protein
VTARRRPAASASDAERGAALERCRLGRDRVRVLDRAEDLDQIVGPIACSWCDRTLALVVVVPATLRCPTCGGWWSYKSGCLDGSEGLPS